MKGVCRPRRMHSTQAQSISFFLAFALEMLTGISFFFRFFFFVHLLARHIISTPFCIGDFSVQRVFGIP